ncbi:acyl-CoA dehydrogenase family protein [Mycobacterium sp.]|uniref:acyl-CoA dehydrogenase family protein n=1 Tax=Mycobacterium sp. TaxID=1785 RepID=UPI003F950F76
MTETLSGSKKKSKSLRPRVRRRGSQNGVGLQPHKRTGIDIAIAVLTPLVGQEFLDKYHLRDPLNRGLRYGTKTVFSTTAATTRQFKRVQSLRGGPTRLKSSGKDLFDLTPDDDQKMIVETIDEFAAEILRPAAPDADEAATCPRDLIAKAAELGITAVNIPEDFDGIAEHRSSVTNVLVAEALAYGDMGLALPILAPGGVASALTHWGGADQQATYLPEFAGENVPQACVAIAEPQPLFDPTRLKTTAMRTPSGYRLDGVKSLVPAAADAELFIVGAQLNGKPALFIVESSTKGLTVKADPSMGIRAAALGHVELRGVSVPLGARLGEPDAADAQYDEAYSEAVALSRLGWAALAVGTSHAVLDYVVPYVKEREAFGEPVAHRQAVAFMCANIAIELDGLRLITWRGAARAEQGLPFIREAALAKRLGADKGMQIGLDGVQLLGGHGFTKEHPVERWYRDLRAIGVAEGVVVI